MSDLMQLDPLNPTPEWVEYIRALEAYGHGEVTAYSVALLSVKAITLQPAPSGNGEAFQCPACGAAIKAPQDAKQGEAWTKEHRDALLWAMRTASDKANYYDEKGDQEQRDYCSDTRDTLKAILSALTMPQAQPQASQGGEAWQPIESAPKDGGRVLGFDPHRDVAICHMERDGKWYPSDEAARFDGFFQPTYWMPLPAAPSVNKGD